MDYKTTVLENFYIAGISVRTINKDGKAQKDLGELQHKFFTRQIAATIPNKVSDDVYCAYTDYESDFMGEYTAILGCKVSSVENLPKGLIVKEIPMSTYRVYKSEGKLPECIAGTWAEIWRSPDNDRAYKADFEIYGAEAQNPENAAVYTYLSVKE